MNLSLNKYIKKNKIHDRICEFVTLYIKQLKTKQYGRLKH